MNIAQVYLDALELLETREVPAHDPTTKCRYIFILNACCQAAGYGDIGWDCPTEDAKALRALAKGMVDLPL
tara:strand:+ start:438 stop:650 length:213 start_codon:yes stop_codon:yes gene_type:complete